jgi:hypothetical protein
MIPVSVSRAGGFECVAACGSRGLRKDAIEFRIRPARWRQLMQINQSSGAFCESDSVRRALTSA